MAERITTFNELALPTAWRWEVTGGLEAHGPRPSHLYLDCHHMVTRWPLQFQTSLLNLRVRSTSCRTTHFYLLPEQNRHSFTKV